MFIRFSKIFMAFVLAALATLGFVAEASFSETATKNSGLINFEGGEYLLDKDGSLDHAKIFAKHPGEFRKIGAYENNFGYSQGVHWIRWKFRQDKPEMESYIIFGSAFSIWVDAAIYDASGKVHSAEHWDLKDRRNRSINPSFKLPDMEGDYTIILGIHSPFLGSAYAEMGSRHRIPQLENRQILVAGIYIGIVSILLAYQLIFLVKFRLRISAAYVIFAFTMALPIVLSSGILDFYAPSSRFLWMSFLPLSRCLPIIALFWFSFEILPRARVSPWREIIVACLILGAVSAILTVVVSVKLLLLNDLLNVAGLFILMWVSIASMSRREKNSKIFFISISSFVIGVSVWTMGNVGILPQTYWVENAPVFANIFEIVLLTIVFSVYFDDIKQAKIEVQESKKRESFKENLLRVISHDLTSPLTIINSYNENILRLIKIGKIQNVNPEIIRSVNATIKASKQMVDIVYRVKTLILGQNAQHALEQTSITQVVQDSLFLSVERGKQKGVEVIFTAPDRDYAIMCDTVGLRSQVLGNILTNAVKFSPPQGKVEVGIYSYGNRQVAIEIRDHGDGIPDEVLADLRTKTYTKSSQGTSGETGTGFGLGIALQTAASMGAEVKITTTLKSQSEKDSGTTITILFLVVMDQIAA